MLPDVVQYDTLLYGKQREGTMYSWFVVLQQVLAHFSCSEHLITNNTPRLVSLLDYPAPHMGWEWLDMMWSPKFNRIQ